MNDFGPIREALRLARRLARHHRRGGLAELCQLAGAALDRIEAGSPEQLPLALFPRDLSRQAHDLRSQAVALNTQPSPWRSGPQPGSAPRWARPRSPVATTGMATERSVGRLESGRRSEGRGVTPWVLCVVQRGEIVLEQPVGEDVPATDFAEKDATGAVVEEGDDVPGKAVVAVEKVAEDKM